MDLLKGFDDHQVNHVQRSYNEAAHRIPKDCCDNKLCKALFAVPQVVL
jgi:hypothetical protein